MDGQMKRGVLEMCLLWIIATEETYGYRLLERVADLFPGQPERTAYAILQRLLAGGYTEAYCVESSAGPQRKYYRMTAEGRAYLAELMQEWNSLAQAVAELTGEQRAK